MGYWVMVWERIRLAQNTQPITRSNGLSGCNGLSGRERVMGYQAGNGLWAIRLGMGCKRMDRASSRSLTMRATVRKCMLKRITAPLQTT